MKGATEVHNGTTLRRKSFNPRTHEGCDEKEGDLQRSYGVSIHAPMKGATQWAEYNDVMDYVSIHAPMKGATVKKGPRKAKKVSFNPRTHEV